MCPWVCQTLSLYTVSQKTGLLRLICHNFTNSQHLLIIFCRGRPHSILSWRGKKFLNSPTTSCVVAITTVATWHTEQRFSGLTSNNRIIDGATNEWQNDCGPVLKLKDSTSNTCCNFWYHKAFCCSDRNTVCLNDLTFMFIRRHKLYTVHCVSKKYTPWCLIITLANVDRFSKLFTIYSYENAVWDFHHTCNILLHYVVKVENSKMLMILTTSSTNCWHVPQDTLRTLFNI